MKLQDMEMKVGNLNNNQTTNNEEEKNEVEMKSKGDRIELSKDSNSSNLLSNENDPQTSKM